MEPQIKEVLIALHKKARKNALSIFWTLPKIIMQKLSPKDMEHIFISITQKQGEFLYNTILEHRCKNIVEFGTSFGLSTIYLAAAAKHTGGKVTTSELLESKCKIASENFENAGVSQYIDIKEGDALKTLKDIDGEIDFVFMDGWKTLYLPVICLLEPKFKKGCVVVADNVDFINAKKYLKYVRSGSSYESGYVKQFGHTTEKSIWRG